MSAGAASSAWFKAVRHCSAVSFLIPVTARGLSRFNIFFGIFEQIEMKATATIAEMIFHTALLSFFIFPAYIVAYLFTITIFLFYISC